MYPGQRTFADIIMQYSSSLLGLAFKTALLAYPRMYSGDLTMNCSVIQALSRPYQQFQQLSLLMLVLPLSLLLPPKCETLSNT